MKILNKLTDTVMISPHTLNYFKLNKTVNSKFIYQFSEKNIRIHFECINEKNCQITTINILLDAIAN